MKYSLRTKLSVSYILVALFCVTLVMILANVLLEKQFKEYIVKNQEARNKSVVSTIEQQYSMSKSWNLSGIETIGVSALENGLIIKVKDKEDKLLWDATFHNNGTCQRILQKMSQNLYSRYPGIRGAYAEKPYPLYLNASRIGTLIVGSYGPFNLSDNDLAFIGTLNKMLYGVGIISFFFALLLGSIIAKRLSSPIAKVINTAQMISKGFFTDRVSEKSNTTEISQLTDTVNHLADTLEKQELLRKRLTADVAHELRTPLATLQSHMEAMIDGIWDPDAARLKSCHEEIVRISKMTCDLEKLAKFESESLILNKSVFEPTEVIKNIIMNFQNDFRNKGIELNLNEQHTSINADRDKISQVMVNLVSNALKYTPDGGKVDISVTGDEHYVEIKIKDNGNGIPEADLPYVFERCYRADKSRNRLTGGCGIGLTIVKAIIDAHKGQIKLKSRINEGTEIVLILPKD